MKIFHGDEQAASRAAFLAAKDECAAGGKQIASFDGGGMALADLVNAVETRSLFGDENAVFIENFFSRRPSNEKKQIVEYISKKSSADIFFWDGRDISSQLKPFPPGVIRKFDPLKSIFKFLDSLNLDLYRQSLRTSEAEQILALLAKRIHDLILVKEGKGDFPSWQKTKLETQSRKYSQEDLYELNLQLLELDFKNKNSLLPFDLARGLELWLLKLVH